MWQAYVWWQAGTFHKFETQCTYYLALRARPELTQNSRVQTDVYQCFSIRYWSSFQSSGKNEPVLGEGQNLVTICLEMFCTKGVKKRFYCGRYAHSNIIWGVGDVFSVQVSNKKLIKWAGTDTLCMWHICPPLCKQKDLVVHLKLPWGNNVGGSLESIIEETNLYVRRQ